MPSHTQQVHVTLAPKAEERDVIRRRINDADNKINYIHRSYRNDEHSGIAVLTQLDDAGELIIDRYTEAIQASQLTVSGLEDERIDAQAISLVNITTAIIETAQDIAKASSLMVEDFLPLQRRTQTMSSSELDELLKLPDSPRVPLTTDGFELGAQSLFLPPQKHVQTFRSYALAKLAGLHAGNCDADLYASTYDAIRLEEYKLYKSRRIDDLGRPTKPDGSTYWHLQAQIQVMSAWFVEMMLSIDRVLGRYVGKKLVRHTDKPAKPGEKTIRVDAYLVLGKETTEEDKLEVEDRSVVKSNRRKQIKERARSDDEADLEE